MRHWPVKPKSQASCILLLPNPLNNYSTFSFWVRYESEKALRQSVQNDVEHIRKELDNMTIIITDLEMEIEALRENHILKRKEHEEVGFIMRAIVHADFHRL